jgi:hypothetical protein
MKLTVNVTQRMVKCLFHYADVEISPKQLRTLMTDPVFQKRLAKQIVDDWILLNEESMSGDFEVVMDLLGNIHSKKSFWTKFGIKVPDRLV